MEQEQYTKVEITINFLGALGWLLASGALLVAAYGFSRPEWAAAAKAWGG